MIVAVRKAAEVKRQEWPWPSFTPEEMACSLTGRLEYDPDFMNWLQALRYIHGKPMTISSGYRSPEHQKTLPGGRTTGAHVDGMAVDVKVFGQDAHSLVKLALGIGALGVGVHQTGPWYNRYIHIDRWTSPEGLKHRPSLWNY